MTENYQTVHECSDPIEGEMLEDILTQNGLSPRLLGTRMASLVGAAQHIFTLKLEVPESQVKQAEEQIRAFLDYRAEDSKEDEEPEMRPKTRMMAAGVVVIFPGAGQYYIGRPWMGLLLTITFFSGFFFLTGNRTTYAAIMILAGTLLADLVLGQITFNKAVNSPRKSRLWQLGVGVLTSLALLSGCLGINYLLPAYKPEPVNYYYPVTNYPQAPYDVWPFTNEYDDIQSLLEFMERSQGRPWEDLDERDRIQLRFRFLSPEAPEPADNDQEGNERVPLP